MDFELDQDLQSLKELCADFGKNEIYPLVKGWDQEDQRITKELTKKAGDMGLLGLTIPEEFGGIGMGYKAYAVAVEELCHSSRASITMSIISGANGSYSLPIIHFGTEEQKEKYLPGIISGDIQGAMAITEPSGSSSLNDMATKAVFEDGHWVLNGQKVFITRGDTADIIITIASTPEGDAAFLVPTDNPGCIVAKSEEKMGHRGFGLNPVYYDNCILPEGALLGKVGEGRKIAADSLYEARMSVGAACVGVGQAAIELAVEYAKERMINGKRLSSYQNTQFVLAEAQTQIDAARLLVYRCADAMDKGTHSYHMSSMAKYYASEACAFAVDKALQVFGGYGYMRDYDIERIYRDVRVLRILDGATEIHKRLISKWMGVR